MEKKTKIIVLGSGLVGAPMCIDLTKESDFEVTAADIDSTSLKSLEKRSSLVKTTQVDLSQAETGRELVKPYDLVISAVPGHMGFQTLKAVIEAKKDVVDIAFFPEDPFLLDAVAKENDVTAVVDCGVAPGLCNIILGYLETRLDQIDRYVCYVGGLPKVRQWPYEYKAVFSPKDVLEEYTRPARFVEFGHEVVEPALSGVELLDFPRAGTLEAFNTDGLRSLAKTMNITFMKEKTLRFPGHAELMRVFRESGFFSTEPVEIDGEEVNPLAFTSKLLFDQWTLKEGEEDFTVMQVIIEGRKGVSRVRYVFDLYDEYDRETGTSSMARTTGYTCAIAARQVLNRLFTQKGICPPEFIGRTDGCYKNVISECEKRNIHLTETVVELEEAQNPAAASPQSWDEST
ncbi:MAG: saccharopine dehydrogenase NADP-binding domain-containing protein [Deltaproteobacteria bacterium]|nr:saccharopine dehydrogenase NADP-binding domain-containing protein [Deltaproteobacteria bacterium]